MPIVKAGGKIIFYAHVPKCGGSAVSWYLKNRFGDIAFNDNRYTRRPERDRWSKTSPQHIDVASMGYLFPDSFFDATFTIVRHPVSRLISAYHFQAEVEGQISQTLDFSSWLLNITEDMEENPFVYDNHVRPMSDIAPSTAQVFYMEHGLDAMIPWFDQVTGQVDGPRAVPQINKRGEYKGKSTTKVEPSSADLDLIANVYGADFERFGYDITTRTPNVSAPALTDSFIEERDVELKRLNSSVKGYINAIRQNLFSKG